MKIKVFILRPKNLVRLRAQTSETRFLPMFLVKKIYKPGFSPRERALKLQKPGFL